MIFKIHGTLTWSAILAFGLLCPCLAFGTEESDLEYRIGPGDVINISVEHIPEISKSYTVNDKGMIVFPDLLEPIEAKGLTIDELKAKLREVLKEYIREPKVLVEITGYNSHKVLILGAFRNSGVYILKKERIPILDLITEAGGLIEIKENDELIVRRLGSFNAPVSDENTVIRINLKKLILEGDKSQNILIQSGDIISLESFFTSKKNVYVMGGDRQIASVIPYEPGLTLLTAIIKAGISTQVPEITVLRKQQESDEFVATQVKFDPTNPAKNDIILLPDDIITLPDSSQTSINVTGEVRRQGTVPYREGITVFDVIQASGGVTEKAASNKIKVLRKSGSGRTQIIVNMNNILENWNGENDTVLMPGDIVLVPAVSVDEDVTVSGKVNNPKIVPYEPGMTVWKAILLAGGLANNAVSSQIRIIKKTGEVLPVFSFDISRGQSSSTNFTLEQGDQIIVLGPSPENSIIITGKVVRQGIIDYEEGLSAFGAIMKAGGFAEGAAKSKVTIIRGEGKQQTNIRVDLSNLDDRSKDVKLMPGDIIRVPETLF